MVFISPVRVVKYSKLEFLISKEGRERWGGEGSRGKWRSGKKTQKRAGPWKGVIDFIQQISEFKLPLTLILTPTIKSNRNNPKRSTTT